MHDHDAGQFAFQAFDASWVTPVLTRPGTFSCPDGKSFEAGIRDAGRISQRLQVCQVGRMKSLVCDSVLSRTRDSWLGNYASSWSLRSPFRVHSRQSDLSRGRRLNSHAAVSR